MDGRVVVGDELAVDLDQQVVRPGDAVARARGLFGRAARPARLRRCVGLGHGRTVSAQLRRWHDPRQPRPLALPLQPCRRAGPSAASSGRRSAAATTSSYAVRASRVSPSRASWPARGARVLMLDRYEIGERQTSACAAPDRWLRGDGRRGLGHARPSASWSSTRRTAPSRIRAAVDLLHLRLPGALCELLWEQCDAEFETAKVSGAQRRPTRRHTDRGDISAPLIVDALGWRRVLPPTAATSRPTRRSPAGSRSIREGRRRPRDLDRRRYVSGRLRMELPGPRRAADRRRLLRPPLPRQGADRAARRATSSVRRPLPGQLDPAQASARHRGRHLLRRATRPGTACR